MQDLLYIDRIPELEKRRRAIAHQKKLDKINHDYLYKKGDMIWWTTNHQGQTKIAYGAVEGHYTNVALGRKNYRVRTHWIIRHTHQGWFFDPQNQKDLSTISMTCVHNAMQEDLATLVEKLSGISLLEFQNNPCKFCGDVGNKPDSRKRKAYEITRTPDRPLWNEFKLLRGGAKKKLQTLAKRHDTDVFDIATQLKQQGVLLSDALLNSL